MDASRDEMVADSAAAWLCLQSNFMKEFTPKTLGKELGLSTLPSGSSNWSHWGLLLTSAVTSSVRIA